MGLFSKRKGPLFIAWQDANGQVVWERRGHNPGPGFTRVPIGMPGVIPFADPQWRERMGLDQRGNQQHGQGRSGLSQEQQGFAFGQGQSFGFAGQQEEMTWGQSQRPSQQEHFGALGGSRHTRGSSHHARGASRNSGTQQNADDNTRLGGKTYRSFDGYESDDPQMYHPRFGGVGPPNTAPHMPHQPTRRSHRHSRRTGGHHHEGHTPSRGQFQGSQRGNPLDGWGEQGQNWAAPRGSGARRSHLAPETVYDDEARRSHRRGRGR